MGTVFTFVVSLFYAATVFGQDGGAVNFVDKDVQSSHAGKSRPLQKGDSVPWGSTLLLGAGAKLQLTVGEQKIFLLGKAKVTLRRAMVAEVGTVELHEGQLRMHTPHMPPTFTGEPMIVVTTPTAAAGVRGTEFWISYAVSGETEVIGIEKDVDLMTADHKSRVAVKPGEWGGVGGKYGRVVRSPKKAPVEKVKQIKSDLEFHDAP